MLLQSLNCFYRLLSLLQYASLLHAKKVGEGFLKLLDLGLLVCCWNGLISCYWYPPEDFFLFAPSLTLNAVYFDDF